LEVFVSTSILVPFHRPSIGQEEIDEVVKTLESGWLTTGPKTVKLEQEFREYVGASFAQAVNSGTSGLHLALAASDIGPGMEVITSALTFCSTVNTILHVGATPVLADVGNDGNIDPSSVAARITERTRAIVPVHFAGLPCQMDAIWTLARGHKLRVIEDSAHAAGARYRGSPIGADHSASGDRSDASVFSFYATKNLTTGEGGIVTTHDEALANSLKILCLHGISKSAWNRYSDRGNWYYEVLRPGFKYNLTDIQASIGIHQLRKLEGFIEARAALVEMYNRAFAEVEELEIPPDRDDCRHAWHLYTLRLNLDKLEINRDEFIDELGKMGIGVSVHFIPIPLHPFFVAFADKAENQCPGAIALYKRLISLPLYPAMTEEQIEYVAESVKEIARRARRHAIKYWQVAGT
jgi:dTDP-4-amino-4,6-dideoxygalactose transaminase